ncbi:uncharacterized protein B0I36DRAFT_367037 [Microdochium trichocladiopsis]|uniref:EthD domain-containing protein n=1 Tax=Microdochium trichocladiopsis TaxID=1682393 RepID=A0A9P8Y0U4_9PEZI|nr:uncharacterized protein B0I36DRAFT_367037 [Microdochium trichocladiopsis]KAH7025153.1 hypothetical protein B0I36DRAFT_367037 [Microdochium trichocladiopsis]
MTAPKRTAYTGSAPAGPGLIYASSHITSPDLTPDVFNRWYNEHHIPDVLATGAVSHAARWEVADRDPATRGPDPYLATYRVPDMRALQGEAFARIPMTHELLPGGGGSGTAEGGEQEDVGGGKTVHGSVDIDTCFYELVEVFEKVKHDEAFATHIISAGMTPKDAAASDDMDRWYREEHNEQMSLEPGWIRSTRYKLAFHVKSVGGDKAARGDAPEWMTLHEFGEGNTLGEKVAPLVPISDWTRKVMGDMTSIEAYVWRRTKGWTK